LETYLEIIFSLTLAILAQLISAIQPVTTASAKQAISFVQLIDKLQAQFEQFADTVNTICQHANCRSADAKQFPWCIAGCSFNSLDCDNLLSQTKPTFSSK